MTQQAARSVGDQMTRLNAAYSLLATQDPGDRQTGVRVAEMLRAVAAALLKTADNLAGDGTPTMGDILASPMTGRWQDRPTPTPPPAATILRPIADEPTDPKTPVVTVHRPTHQGSRQVIIDGHPAGFALSLDDVYAFMKNAGVEHDEIEWRGGGPAVWPV